MQNGDLKGFLDGASKIQFDFKKLVSVTGDSAPAMVASKNAFAFLLEQYAKKIGNKVDIIKFHCIIHKKTLFANQAGFADVMKVIVKAVNLILFHALNKRQFQDLLTEINSQ